MANEVAPWEEANNLEPFDVVVPKGVKPISMAKDIQAGKITIKQSDEPPWEEDTPWESDKTDDKSYAGVPSLPSMPEGGPAVRPKAIEQAKVFGYIDAIPDPVKTEIQKKGIELQREKKYGVINKAPAFSLENAITNIPKNAEEIVRETGSLLMNIGRLAKNALVDHDALNEQLKPAVEFTQAAVNDLYAYSEGKKPTELAKRPIVKAAKQGIDTANRQGWLYTLGKVAESRPLDTLLFAQGIKTLVGKGIRISAEGLNKAIPSGTKIGDTLDSFLSTERNPIVFEMPVEVSEGTQTAKTIEFPREYSTDPFTKYIYEKSFDKALDIFPKAKEALAEHKANKLIDKMRNTYDNANFIQRSKLNEEVLKKVNKLSKEEQAIVVPYLEGRVSLIGDTSEQFKKFEDYYRNLSTTIADDLADMGKLTPEQVRERLYQPITKATGLTTEQVVADMGDFLPAYIHHIFPQTFREKMGTFFADTTGKRFNPSFLKQSKGVAGYSEDLKQILPKWVSEYVKFKNTEAFIKDFTNQFGIPANIRKIEQVSGGYKVGDKVYKGYRIVAPDGYLNFYRGNIDFYKEVSKRLEGMEFDEAVADAVSNAFIGEGKQFMGVAKNRTVYLVPENVAKRLESYATPLFGSQKIQNTVKMVYDKPTQLWKDTVLAAAPRWIKNNLMGDIFFNTMEGVGPVSYTRSFLSKYKDIIPDELFKASMANTMKYNPKLGMAAQTTIGRFAQAIGDTPVVRGAERVKDFAYGLNTMFEQPFVRSLYVKLSREKAVSELKAAKMPVSEESIMAKLSEYKNTPAMREPIINKVKETLPIFDLTGNFERKYLRRAIPFYNWYKFMTLYAAKLPFNHPFKTVGLRGLGDLSEDQREQAFIQMFPYMQREIEESGIPERFSNLWPVKLDKDGKAVFFNARGFNVFTTVEDLLKGNVLNMASPLIKLPIERGTGRESFTGRDYRTGDEGIDYREKALTVPPLGEHILKQFPQHELLKQTLVPARQYDSGTIMNPEPIVDKITGEYKYPIDSIEKWLNYAGIDKKTFDVRKMYESYRQEKAKAIGETFTKQQSVAETALTLDEVTGLFVELKKDKVKWKRLIHEMKDKALEKAKNDKKKAAIIRESKQE